MTTLEQTPTPVPYQRIPHETPLRSRVIVPVQLITSHALNSDAKELYVVLALYTDASGTAFVRQRTLAAHCRCSVRYIHILLSSLRTSGFVQWSIGTRANLYRLAFPP